MSAEEDVDRAAYQALKKRWDALRAWATTPAAQPWSPILTQDTGYWIDFSKRWEENRKYLFDSIDDHEHSELAQMVRRLDAVEEDAKKKGYQPAEETTIPIQSREPGILDRAGQAVWTKKATYDPKTGEKTSETQGGVVGGVVENLPAGDQYLPVKVGALGAMALGTAAGALAARGDAARIGVAVGGAVATLAAALWMFWPASPASKQPKERI